MPDVSATLDLIDNAVDDCTSGDAMRWSPHASTAAPQTGWWLATVTVEDCHRCQVHIWRAPRRVMSRIATRTVLAARHRQRREEQQRRVERASARRIRRLYGRKHGHA